MTKRIRLGLNDHAYETVSLVYAKESYNKAQNWTSSAYCVRDGSRPYNGGRTFSRRKR